MMLQLTCGIISTKPRESNKVFNEKEMIVMYIIIIITLMVTFAMFGVICINSSTGDKKMDEEFYNSKQHLKGRI